MISRYLIVTALFIFLVGLVAHAQDEIASPNLLLYVSYGKPDEGGSVQQFQLRSGDTTFIQVNPIDTTPKQTPQEAQQDQAYKLQLAKISTEIAQKISTIQAKQYEIDNEIFIAHRPPLENERRQLEQDLEVLQQRRNQIQSQRTAREALKPPPVPSRPPTIARGITVTPSIQGESATLFVSTQGEDPIQASIDTPLNNWVQVYGSRSEGGQEIWVKVELAR